MNIGVVNWVLGCALLGISGLACGGTDDAPAANCGTAQAPMAIEIKDVSPAADASLPNSAIVQSFTLVGRHLQIEPSFILPVAHTAGQPVPAQGRWTLAVSGADTVYTSEPLTWTTAPAHVEIHSSGLLQTSDGCILALPKQMFKYDISKP
ncbi:MAG TPA: hypothetical protein VJV79_08840 [Polyangiaceae bacterium]|nr:hypothetical protein [Polyangiaceae bacterium]